MSLRKFWIPFLVLIVVGLMLFMLKALVFTDGTDWLMNIVDQVPLVGNLLSGFGSGIFTDDDTARQILNDWSLMIRVIELEIVKAELIGVIIYLLNEILGLFLSSLWRVILSSLLGVTMGLFIFKAFTFAGTWGPMLPLLILLAAALVEIFFKPVSGWQKGVAYVQMSMQLFTAMASAFLAATLAALLQMDNPSTTAYINLLVLPYLYVLLLCLVNHFIDYLKDEMTGSTFALRTFVDNSLVEILAIIIVLVLVGAIIIFG